MKSYVRLHKNTENVHKIKEKECNKNVMKMYYFCNKNVMQNLLTKVLRLSIMLIEIVE